MSSCNPSDAAAASISSIGYSFTDSWPYSGICQFELWDIWHYGTQDSYGQRNNIGFVCL
jgi:hypothetical protein